MSKLEELKAAESAAFVTADAASDVWDAAGHVSADAWEVWDAANTAYEKELERCQNLKN